MKQSTGISVKHAAFVLEVSDARIRQMLLAKELRGVKVNQRSWLVDGHDVEAMVKARKRAKRGSKTRR